MLSEERGRSNISCEQILLRTLIHIESIHIYDTTVCGKCGDGGDGGGVESGGEEIFSVVIGCFAGKSIYDVLTLCCFYCHKLGSIWIDFEINEVCPQCSA